MTSNPFFDHPILNSPYERPARHWELDKTGQPTQQVIDDRRPAKYIMPIAQTRKRKDMGTTVEMVFDEGEGLSTEKQQYDPLSNVNQVRNLVDQWRTFPPNLWNVTPETQRLLQHWRTFKFETYRPFFCQIEAVETAIWLTEVAPKTEGGKRLLATFRAANEGSNPELFRLALKLATGAGKTTVMAMLIAWQTINAVRSPQSKRFTRGFLVVTPGLTIRDRLRVLLPNDPDNYYKERNLVPVDLLEDVQRARIVITNYHAFKRRETLELSKGSRALLQGNGPELSTIESEGQMLKRVIPELMGLGKILVLNDEAHHCYRESAVKEEGEAIKGEEKVEAEKNNEAARLWITGLEATQRKIGLLQVFDLSATPFFLRGSGYAEGTLFPWTVCDFSLMDAIECGIVKLPRVPVADNVPGTDMPLFRDLWPRISAQMPKKGRGQSGALEPLKIPILLRSALDALYGHYERTFEAWKEAGIKEPPCFIVVCNNTSTSKLVYDYISGFRRTQPDGTEAYEAGRLALFRNFDENGNPLARPHTLLIDSQQLESGEALDDNFRGMAEDEIERFRREIVERTGDQRQAENLTDADLLREVMNTVGKPGRLGEQIRCVVSVSMLTEGWDANTVTHVLGVRAFGTQLLCEQVIGRALRRQSYDLNGEGLFEVEYADVLGVPFDFTAKPVVVKPVLPRVAIQVRAVRPERDHLEIRFPRVEGYRFEPGQAPLSAEFGPDSHMDLTPEHVGPTVTQNMGIIGVPIELTPATLNDMRESTVTMKLTQHLLMTRFRDEDGGVNLNRFGELRRIVRQWLGECLHLKGGTVLAQITYLQLADTACERIMAGINRAEQKKGEAIIRALLDPFNPTGSTAHVNFTTSKTSRWDTGATPTPKNHVNWVVLDSDWEAEFCRIVERHPRVVAYTKNHSLGFEVPYRRGAEPHMYRPDFIVLIDDGHGPDNLLHLVAEVKGYRGEDVKDKQNTMETLWIPGVNTLKTYGRWAFAEFKDIYEIEADFSARLEAELDRVIDHA